MRYLELVKLVSKPRINKYLRAVNNSEILATQAYFLNINIAGDIFKAISFLEISIRNRIDDIVPAVLSCHREWLFEIIKGKISTSPDFRQTRIKIKTAIKASKDETHNQVLCQLSFGFWCSLFSGYNFMIIGSKIMKNLAQTKAVDPELLRVRLHNIRLIRNRIAHQEPIIFGRNNKLSSVELTKTLRDIYWVQAYFCSRKLSQIAFYEQIKKDITRLDWFIAKQKPSGMKNQ